MLDLENVYFLGKDAHSRKFNKYIDKSTKDAMYDCLFAASSIDYRKSSVERIFLDHITEAERNNYPFFCISDENFCHPGWHIETQTMLTRMLDIIGKDDTDVVIIIRKQWDYMKSYYHNMIRTSNYPHSYQFFCEYVLLHYNCFLMPYLEYDKLIDSLSNITPNLKVITLAEFTSDESWIHKELNVNNIRKHVNKSLPESWMEWKRKKSYRYKIYRHDAFYNRFLWPTYKNHARNNSETFTATCDELDTKYNFNSRSNKLISRIDRILFNRKLNYDVTENVRNALSQKFNESNQRLNDKYNIKL